MFSGIAGEEQRVALTLFTDAYVIRGHIRTRQRRVTDMLNQAENSFLVLTDVLLDEYGSRSVASKADYAQVNLDSVLFAVAENPVDAVPELRTPKVPEQALISIPPFKVVGRIHLLPERELHDALSELTGRFIPVTEALYWSESAGEARTGAALVAVNHARAQIMAPHREVDPWAGLDRAPAAVGAAVEGEGANGGESPSAGDAGWGTPSGGAVDPWGAGAAGSTPAVGQQDPWADLPAAANGGAVPVRDPWADLPATGNGESAPAQDSGQGADSR